MEWRNGEKEWDEYGIIWEKETRWVWDKAMR